MKRDSLLALASDLNAKVPFDRTFMVSALNGSGVDDVLAFFAEAVPKGHWLYPEDQISDLPMRQLAAEITREKMMLRLHEELPYASTVETEAWKELKGGAVRIEQTIYVERDSQKKIVLGKGGQTVKAISQERGARGDHRDPRAARASLPVREGARELVRRSGALPRDGSRFPRLSRVLGPPSLDARGHCGLPLSRKVRTATIGRSARGGAS